MNLRHLIYKPIVWLMLAAMVLNGSAALAKTNSPSRSDQPEATLVAPANDNFANAQLLSGATGSVTGANSGATKEAGEPVHARNRGGASVWYKYVAPGNGTVTFDATSSSFDTLMAVYKGTGFADLKRIAANDDTFSGLRSVVTVGTQINDVFYIAMDGFYNSTSATYSTGTVGLNYGFTNSVNNDNFANAQPLTFTAGKMITTTNVGASRESGEPTSGNPGGKSVWYKWVAPSGINTSYTFTVESANLPATAGVKTIAGIYSGTALNNLNLIVDTVAINHLELSFGPTPGQTYYFTVDGFDGGTGAQMGTFTIDYGITRDRKTADFDDDGLADITVFRPSTGSWYTLDSVTGQLRSTQFGTNGDRPLLTDLGTDGKLDYLVFRPDTGAWYINDSEAGFRSFQWGLSGDVPLIRSAPDANNFGIFRDVTGSWSEFNLSFQSGNTYPWGKAGDIPVYTYFNFYGYDGPTVFRPSTGTWYTRLNNFNYTAVNFGLNGDKPVPSDYDGDGVADYAVFRPSNGTWYIKNSSNGAVTGIPWGLSTDIPQPADFDGDGKSDLAVFRSGTWYIRQSSNGSLRVVQFGQTGDIPVTAPIH